MATNSYSTADLAAILGKTHRFIMDWCDRGLLIADVQSASGPGSRRAFSFAGLLRALLGFWLQINYGVNRAKLKEMLDLLWSENFFQDWASGFKISRDRRRELNKKAWELAHKKLGREGGAPQFELPEKKGEDGCLIIINHNTDHPIVLALDMTLYEAFSSGFIEEKLKVAGNLIAIDKLINLKIALLTKIKTLGL